MFQAQQQAASKKRMAESKGTTSSILSKRRRASNPNPHLFEMRQTARRAHEFTILNQAFKKHVEELKTKRTSETTTNLDDESLSELELLQGAYRMSAREINLRFGGGPLGYVVTFGSNDGSGRGVEETSLDGRPQFMDGTQIENKLFRSIECQSMGNVALGVDGVPYTFGADDDYVLGPVKGKDGIREPLPLTGFVTQDGTVEDGTITQVAIGGAFTLYLTERGNVYSCGMYKEVSDPFCIPPPDAPTDVEGHNKTPQHIWNMPGKVIMVFAGGMHAAALLEDHSTLVTWGIGESGENARYADLTVLVNNDLRVPGEEIQNAKGRIDPSKVAKLYMTPGIARFNYGSIKKTILTAACGDSHLLVVAREPNVADTNVYSSGTNLFGELGHGDAKNRAELTLIKKLEGKNIAQVSAGKSFSMAMDMTGKRIYTWGNAENCRLGRGYPATYKTDVGTTAAEEVREPQLLPFPVETPLVFNKIQAGEENGYAITVGNELYSWGTKDPSGHKATSAVPVPRPTKVPLARTLGLGGVDIYDVAGSTLHGVVLVAGDRTMEERATKKQKTKKDDSPIDEKD